VGVRAPVRAPAASTPDFRPAAIRVQGRLLQRKCACRTGSSGTDNCDECRQHATRVQAKLRVSGPDDAFESEADRVAERVVGMRGSGRIDAPVMQSATPLVQRRGGDSHAGVAAPPIVEEVLRSPGQAMDRRARQFFEPRFGHNFSQVRIHTDATAADSADAVNAAAYTVGSHIIFGRGQFDPAGSSGRRLLAHELSHTIQQGATPAAPVVARHPKAPDPKSEEMVVTEAPRSVDPSEQPWFVYSDAALKGDRKALLPKDTRVATSGGQLVEMRDAGNGKKKRVTFRRVRVLAMPAQNKDAENVIGKTGVIQAQFLAPAKSPPAAAAATAAPRYSAKELEAKRTGKLREIAQLAVEKEYAKARQAATISHIAVKPNMFGGYGGPAQMTAQVLAEPMKEQLLAVHAKLAELADQIEKHPLFTFFSGLVDGIRANLDVKVFADNAETFAKFAAYWSFKPTLQARFLAGTAIGVKKEIEGLIDLVTEFDQVLEQILQLAEAVMSEGGAEVTRGLGYQIGSDWAKQMTAIGGITDLDKLAQSLGETFGPLLLEIALGVATAGSSAAASASARMSSLLAKFPKLAKFIDKVKDVRKALPGKKKLPDAPHVPKPDPRHVPKADTPRVPKADVPDAPKPDAPDAPAKKKSGAPGKRLPDADSKELRGMLEKRGNLQPVTDETLLSEGYHLEVRGKDHTYRRKTDGSWCRFSTRECGFEVDPEIAKMVDRGIVEEKLPQGPAEPRRPEKVPAKGFTEQAREAFKKVREKYVDRLGVRSAEDVHHAIELKTLDRYVGVMKESELNAFENMRGIPKELEGKKQFHNSKIREIWDRHYARIDDEVAKRSLKPGTDQYKDFVRKNLEAGRLEIDHMYEEFFTEVKRGLSPGVKTK